ncbi:hypothetical protein GMMP15_540016 [Candidatus Magnetomoraceae bacterium gMMP-15]
MKCTCSNCLKKCSNLIPLVEIKTGEKITIKDFAGGLRARMRFLSMGLRPKDKLEVLVNNKKGQIVVVVDCKRYALGWGMANKILVEPEKRS